MSSATRDGADSGHALPPKVLLIHDERALLNALKEHVRSRGLEPLPAADAEEAHTRYQDEDVDLLLTGGEAGLKTIAALRGARPAIQAVLLLNAPDETQRLAAQKAQVLCVDTADLAPLWDLLGRFTARSGMHVPPAAPGPETQDATSPEDMEMAAAGALLGRTSWPRKQAPAPGETSPRPIQRLIGETPAMQQLVRNIAKVAVLDCTVLILGETGTGKELVARSLHRQSSRAQRTFLAVNCGSFSPDLLANELFGHEREAFTGASRTRKGLFEAADGGTILLDEIGETPASMQVQLLRVLQNKTVIRVGGNEEIPVNVRVLAATHRDLEELVAEGTLREDLLYRLNVFVLRIPPLRERRDDIPLLTHYFLEKYRREFGKRVVHVAPQVIRIFLDYPFPGNVRELENAMERAVILCEGDTLTADLLPRRFQATEAAAHTESTTRPDEPCPTDDAAPAKDAASQASSPSPATGGSEMKSLEEMEAEHIRRVMAKVAGNRNEAAEILGISRTSLWRKLKLLDEAGDSK